MIANGAASPVTPHEKSAGNDNGSGAGELSSEAQIAGMLAAALEAGSATRTRASNGSHPASEWKRAGREAQLHNWPQDPGRP
jgi:hypothetical protein